MYEAQGRSDACVGSWSSSQPSTGRQLKTVEQGAATSVWCATSPLLDGLGGLCGENSDVAPPMSLEEGRDWTLMNRSWKAGVLLYAVDPAAAARLWELSERLTA